MLKLCTNSCKIIVTIFLLHSTNNSINRCRCSSLQCKTICFSKRAVSKQSRLWGSTSNKWPHHRKTSTQATCRGDELPVISNYRLHFSITKHVTIATSRKFDLITARARKRLTLAKLIWARLAVHQFLKQVTLAQLLPLITKTCKTISSVYKKRLDTCNSNLDAMMTKMKNHRQSTLYWSQKFKMSRQWAQWITRNTVKV